VTRNIRELKNRYEGATAYVVAAGASLNFLPMDFFANRLVIAVNEMFRHLGSRAVYTLMHHHENGQAAIDAGQRLVTSETSYDMPPRWGQRAAFRGDYITYRTQGYEMSLSPRIDLDQLRGRADDELVVSACTTAEAIQFAAHLGASAIIVCGADGGRLDGKLNIDGYNGGAATNPQHVRLTEGILHAVANAYRTRGVPVVSLNPFIGFGLEGHTFTAPPALHGDRLIRELQTVHTS